LANLHYVLAVRNRWAGVLGDCDIRFSSRGLARWYGIIFSKISMRPLVTLSLRYKQETKTNARIERDGKGSFRDGSG